MTDAPQKRRGRPRRSGADEKILSVARRILNQTGYKEFSVDAVHARTGIAKTTIYRRWPTKAALAAAAMAPMPDAGADLQSLVRDLCAVLNLLAAPDADADAMDVVRATVAPRRDAIRAALAARGNEDPALTADMIVGALLARRLFAATPLDDACSAAVLSRLT